MLKNKFKIFLILICCIFFLQLRTTYAHILKNDGAIGVILHIDPNDEPIGGQDSNIYVNLTDKASTFDAKKCECKIEISKNEKVLFSKDLLKKENPDLSPTFVFKFPEIGIYNIQIKGKPIDNASFKEFNFDFGIRVSEFNDTEDSHQASSHTIIHYIEIGLVIGGFVILVIIDQFQKRKKNVAM